MRDRTELYVVATGDKAPGSMRIVVWVAALVAGQLCATVDEVEGSAVAGLLDGLAPGFTLLARDRVRDVAHVLGAVVVLEAPSVWTHTNTHAHGYAQVRARC